MKDYLAIVRNALRGSSEAERPSYAIIARANSRALIPTPRPEPPSAYELEVEQTGAFVVEGPITKWDWQPGTQTAHVSVQDFALNAAMQGSGQDNINLTLPVALARFLAPQQRVRITVEVL